MPSNPAIEQLLRDVLGMGPLSGLIGGSRGIGAAAGGIGRIAESDIFKAILLWQVLGQVMGPAMAPLAAEIQQEVFSRFPDLVLSPAELANAQIRGYLEAARAEAEAARSGLDAERYRLLVDSNGNPPGLQALIDLWRRGLIPEAGGGADSVSFEQGVREGQTKNKWIPPLKALRFNMPSEALALRAALEGQVPIEEARRLWALWGGHPDYFQIAFNTEGQAPSPLEAAEMARRGIIPWDGEGPEATSFRQAFLEGPWRNKWEAGYRQLAVYRPPVRSIVAMVRNGSISDQQAAEWLKDVGADEQTTALMLLDAHHEKTAETRELAKTEVLALYRDRLIDQPGAVDRLGRLGHSAEDAGLELAVVDYQRINALVKSAVARLHSLYVAHKLPASEVMAALGALSVPPAQIDEMLTIWGLERLENVHVLTPAELAAAAREGWLDAATAYAELQGLGYDDRDAFIFLAIHKVNLAGVPVPAGVSAPGS